MSVHLLSAVEAQYLIERGELSCATYLRACLERADAREAQVGAWEIIDRNRAIAAAQAADSSTRGLLHGLPVGIKDIIDVGSLATKCGSSIYADAPNASIDAASVAIMRVQGAIPLGKTVSTELAGAHPGKTRNPHNLAHTPGGSSSGSAAAVADGHVPLAIGTQTAGSVIRPAAYCGVFGFKPTHGIVPLTGVKVQSETLDTIGVFARSVDDCALWWAAMTDGAFRELNIDSVGQLRIARIKNLEPFASDAMRDALDRAAIALSRAGATVTDVLLPAPLDNIHDDQLFIQRLEAARAYTAEHRQHREQLSAVILEQLDRGATLPLAEYRAALTRVEAARHNADGLFQQYDVWLMPSAPGAAPSGLTSTGDPLFNRLASVLNTPAINIPAYKDAQKLPLGLQLIGARHEDGKLLAVSNWVQCTLRATLAG